MWTNGFRFHSSWQELSLSDDLLDVVSQLGMLDLLLLIYNGYDLLLQVLAEHCTRDLARFLQGEEEAGRRGGGGGDGGGEGGRERGREGGREGGGSLYISVTAYFLTFTKPISVSSLLAEASAKAALTSTYIRTCNYSITSL